METTVAVSLITFLLGLWGGHYFSLLRDKRKEFNEVADRLRKHLMAERPEVLCMCKSPTLFEFDLLTRLLPCWKRRALARAIARYSAAKSDYSNERGSVTQNNVDEARAALAGLIAHTQRR